MIYAQIYLHSFVTIAPRHPCGQHHFIVNEKVVLLNVIPPLIYGPKFFQGFSQMPVMFPSAGLCIWICDLDDRCVKSYVARQIPGDNTFEGPQAVMD